jgi:ubiquinone/menaquinone biosynthesis C-methylase UbiE
MEERTAHQAAAFALPYLWPGMNLLDCGCGPGSITIGLAQIVAPGQVTGIDIGEQDIERARASAQERGVSNIHFERANVYSLPFPDNSFDAVFSNALLEHLAEPPDALREMWRVVKPGGLAAIRAADRDGYLSSHNEPILKRYGEISNRLRATNATAHIGKHLRRLLRQAGFVRVEATASYDSYGTPELVRKMCESGAATITKPGRADELIRTGFTTQAELEEIAAAYRRLAEDPDVFFAQARCEAVGWKE